MTFQNGESSNTQKKTIKKELLAKKTLKMHLRVVGFRLAKREKAGITYLSWMELRNKLTNQVREYWYIGSMFGKSVIEKNNTEACAAIGL